MNSKGWELLENRLEKQLQQTRHQLEEIDKEKLDKVQGKIEGLKWIKNEKKYLINKATKAI